MGKKNGKSRRLTVEEFTLLAIDWLAGVKDKRTGERWHGIHTVYSGFNEAFRAYFPGLDPVAETQGLVEKQIICLRLVKGGALIWCCENKKDGRSDPTNPVNATLEKMGINP